MIADAKAQRLTVRRETLLLGSLLILIGMVAGAWIAWSTTSLQVVTIVAPAGTTSAAVLRAQLEVMQRNAEQLAELVSSSLQVAIGIAFALAAFSWFTNNRLYERDLESLRLSANGEIKAAEASIMTELRKQAAGLAVAQQKVAEAAANDAVNAIAEDLKNLKYEYFWKEYVRFSEAGRAAANQKKWPEAFEAFLSALKAEKQDPYGFTQYAELLDDLEAVARDRQYKPTAEQLSTLERLYKGMGADLQPAIQRLKKACTGA